MENRFSTEQMEKAMACKSVDELLSLAKEYGIVLTEAEAKNYFAQNNPTNGELSDSELETVAGGCGSEECPAGGEHDWHDTGVEKTDIYEQKCRKCGKTQWLGCPGGFH